MTLSYDDALVTHFRTHHPQQVLNWRLLKDIVEKFVEISVRDLYEFGKTDFMGSFEITVNRVMARQLSSGRVPKIHCRRVVPHGTPAPVSPWSCALSKTVTDAF